MSGQPDELFHLKSGVAALAACVVETLNESDSTYRDRFLKKVSEAYHKLRDDRRNERVDDLEILSWTTGLLTGWNSIEGQGEPLLSRKRPSEN